MTAGKLVTVSLALAAPAAGIVARFVAVEQRQEGVQRALVEQIQHVQRLEDRISAIERDRELWSQVEDVKRDMAVVSGRLEDLGRQVRRRGWASRR